MEHVIDVITSNTVYLIIAILIVVMIILAIMKKLFKLFLVAVLVLAGYVGYLAYSGEKIPTNSSEIMDHLKEKNPVEDFKKKGEEAVKEAVKESL